MGWLLALSLTLLLSLIASVIYIRKQLKTLEIGLDQEAETYANGVLEEFSSLTQPSP
jgi:hypothetical protein